MKHALLDYLIRHLPAESASHDYMEYAIEAISILAKTQTQWKVVKPSDYSKKKTRFLSMYDMVRNILRNRDGLLQQLNNRVKKRLAQNNDPQVQTELIEQQSFLVKTITSQGNTPIKTSTFKSKHINEDHIALTPSLEAANGDKSAMLKPVESKDVRDIELEQANIEVIGLKRQLKVQRKQLNIIKLHLKHAIIDLQKLEHLVEDYEECHQNFNQAEPDMK